METILFETVVGLNADAVEAIPAYSGVHNMISVGSYQLDEETGVRKGRMTTYACDTSDDGTFAAIVHETVELPGVLDFKWLVFEQDSG
jgi:hypothetical protein